MKAILVVDMPENCSECSCEQNGICLAKSVAVESIDRPSWCPLRPLPQKKDTGILEGTILEPVEQLIFEGWNACLDEILGETE